MTANVATIPPTASFLSELAQGIFEMAGGMGPDLTRFRILLPTRRACRALQEEFLKLSDGKPLLLPRMSPLGDIDQEELDLMIAGTIESSAIDTIPPAISSLERQMLLTALVQQKNPDMRGEQCLSLARALGRLMDQVYTEDLNLADLPNLVQDENLSIHWLESVKFLTILSETWPLILEQQGRIDGADRRNRLLKLLAKFWEEHPPTTPIIAAGSTGSIPATGNLLRVIANLPQGLVILPGLDRELDQESWNHCGESHPQNTMKLLLQRMDLARDQVKNFRDQDYPSTQRRETVRAATCPAETSHNLLIDKDSLLSGLRNVSLVEADNDRHEAQIIALAIRECLETPKQSAVVITPDRNLARRITANLKRWDIHVDDSAGQGLHMKPAGIYISKILNCLVENFAPVEFLDLLKTPYVSRHFGDGIIAQLEMRALRGPRPGEGLEGLKQRLATLDNNQALLDFVQQLEACFTPLVSFANAPHILPSLVIPLVTTAEHLAGGADKIWVGSDGESLSSLLSELQSSQNFLPPADLRTHQAYLAQFMSERMVRSTFGTHPRVTILGQIEARLIRADLMIMAGLNEGVWPPEPAVDPWMSRPMRTRFGLPPSDRQTGLSAHDFVQGFCMDRVLLTRARKIDGAATVPARWLERIKALLEQSGLKLDLITQAATQTLVAWSQELDRPAIVEPLAKPEPRPPVSLRPKELSVTRIEQLIKNPYQIYAQYVLRVKPLDPLDKDVSSADRGTFIHEILNKFVTQHPHDLPYNSEDILLAMGQDYLQSLGETSHEWHYWWPRFKNLVPAFIEHERNWRQLHRVWLTEVKGASDFIFNGERFTLTARADRVDRKKDGAAIIDYKTGNVPEARNVARGQSPQLPLEAMLLKRGAFDGAVIAENISLNYWGLSGKATPLEIVDIGKKNIRRDGKNVPIVIDDLIRDAEDGFEKLMTMFMNELTPYEPTIPDGRKLYDEEKAYKHLARCDEWSVAGDSEEKDDA